MTRSLRTHFTFLAAAAALTLAACGAPDAAPDGEAATPESVDAGVVNIYTARYYASDYAVYDAFTEATGIEVNYIEAGGDLLIERVRLDAERSPADIVITVDAGRLWRAEQAGLFQAAPELNDVLEGVPANLRHPDGAWFGFSTRVRGVAYAPDRVDASEITDFADLADPRWQGRICVRSSSNVYNQSHLAALINTTDVETAEAWAAGIVANLARAPQGGDTDQIRAVAAGECDLAIVNHYYVGRLKRADDPADRAVGDAVDFIMPPLAGAGSHVNISGAGLAANAPNRENAIAFLTYLLTDGQRFFPELTNEYPAVTSANYDNAVLDSFGEINADPVNVNALGENAGEAQRIFDRVGWP